MYPNTQPLQLGARVRAQLQSAPAPSPERRGCLETVEPRFKPAGPGFTMAKFVLAGEWSPRPPADRSKHRQLLSSYDRLPVILTRLCSSNSSLYMDHAGFIMLSFKNVCWAVTVYKALLDTGDTVRGKTHPCLRGAFSLLGYRSM